MSQSGYVTLEDCTIVEVREKAILVNYDGDEYWFPKTCIADAESHESGDEHTTVMVLDWIAKEKGIEVE